jgi:hypothetical protein
MTDAERLARAVLLFHHGGEWTQADRDQWLALTGSAEATIKVLCDLARRILAAKRPTTPEDIDRQFDLIARARRWAKP